MNVGKPPFSVLLKKKKNVWKIISEFISLQIGNLQIKERPEENGKCNKIPKSNTYKCCG